MPLKLQSFFVLKLSSNRLKEKNYKISITLEEARRNNELVRLGDSELLRAIRRFRNKEFQQDHLNLLLKEKLHLSRKQNSPENRKAIRNVSDKIDEILFEDGIIVLKIDDVRHYKRIIEKGLFINNTKFIRLLCSAGHARRSSVIFCKLEFYEQLNEFLECGRNLEEKINPNKYSTYYALASSASFPVSRPNFVVVNDYEIKKTMKVDWFISQGDEIDPTFEEREIEQTVNVFDGQGLISPTEAQIWSEDMSLDWLPSSFIFRTAFSKGLLVTFDFHKFAYENGINKIIDIYGKEHCLDDIEVILSASQFKMSAFYKSLDEYNENCKKNNFGWGISRYSPRADKDNIQTTYQYIQAMDIDKNKVGEICQPTIYWLKNISGLDYKEVLIFLLGELDNFSSSDFKSADYLAQAIMLEPNVLQDIHIRKKLFHFINKKIKESYTGTLNVAGNYQFLICDPVAQCQHSLGLNVTGGIDEGFAYSQYWNKKEIDKVSCFRSPTTWRSEHLVLELDKKDNAWYNHIYSGIVLNIYNDWPMRLSGGDFDGDLVMTTPSFVESQYPNLNIPTYERKNAEKSDITPDLLWKSDTLSFGSKIGIITNIETTFFSLLPFFIGMPEEDLLINRIKACCTYQNMQIDKTKGIKIHSLPSHWDKWNKDGINSEIYNRLLARQRPYFMRYLYSSWSRKYKHHYSSYDNICIVRFGFSLDVLLKKDVLSDVEQKIKNEFFSRSPLIDSPSTINLICHHMENAVKEIKLDSKTMSFDYHIYMNSDIPVSEYKLHKMSVLLEKWRAFQRNSHDKLSEEITNDDGEIYSKDEYIKVLERESYYISNNLSELSNILVELCYGRHGENSKEFCWKMFGGEGIIKNLLERCRGFVQIPLVDSSGTYDYLGKKYTLTNIVLEDSNV